MTKRNVDHALAYLKRGWSVIPIIPGQKKALVHWADYQYRLPTEDEVKAWWKTTPNANIGVITGKISGIVAVDVDTKRGGDPRPIFEEAPTSLIARTPSGGFHLFYVYPDGASMVQSRAEVREGIDIRGDGGYVVVAPSVGAGDTGYRWQTDKSAGVLPSWVTDARPVETGGQHAPGSERWVTDALAGVTEGGRNNTAARLAGYFSFKGMPLDIVTELLLGWNQKNQPPLDEAEVRRTAESVHAKQVKRGSGAEFHVPEMVDERSTDAWLQPVDEVIRSAADHELVWDIQDWLPRSTIGLIVSPPGAYKTWCMLDLAVSVATGKPFLGHLPVLNTGPVFLFQQEDSRFTLADRLALILQSRYGAGVHEELGTGDDAGWSVVTPPNGTQIWVHGKRELRFDSEESGKKLVAEIDRHRPRLVVIDPLYMAAGEDSSFMADTVQNLRLLKDLRDYYGTTFMIVHHTRKSAGGKGAKPGRMDAWGSQFLNAFLETGWQLRPVFVKADEGYSTNAVSLSRHFKDSGSDDQPLYLQFNIEQDSYQIDILQDVEELNFSQKIVDDDLIKHFQSPNTLAQVARDSGLNKSNVSRRVAKLVEAGMLRVTTAGGKKTWVATEETDDVTLPM